MLYLLLSLLKLIDVNYPVYIPKNCCHHLFSGQTHLGFLWSRLTHRNPLFRLQLGLRRTAMDPCFIHSLKKQQKLTRIAVKQRQTSLFSFHSFTVMVNWEQMRHPLAESFLKHSWSFKIESTVPYETPMPSMISRILTLWSANTIS